jgi:hypothetical protein
MGWKWEDFSSSDKQRMEVEIHKDLITGDLVGISTYLNGLLALHYPLCNSQRMQDVLFAGISRVKVEDHQNSRSVSNSIYSLGELKLDWPRLPQEVRKWIIDGIEWCFSSFNEQEISNIIYGYIASRC